MTAQEWRALGSESQRSVPETLISLTVHHQEPLLQPRLLLLLRRWVSHIRIPCPHVPRRSCHLPQRYLPRRMVRHWRRRGPHVLDTLGGNRYRLFAHSPAGLDGAFWRAFWRYGKDLGLGTCAEDVLRDTVGRYGRGWDVRGGREEVGSYRAFEVEEEW